MKDPPSEITHSSVGVLTNLQEEAPPIVVPEIVQHIPYELRHPLTSKSG